MEPGFFFCISQENYLDGDGVAPEFRTRRSRKIERLSSGWINPNLLEPTLVAAQQVDTAFRYAEVLRKRLDKCLIRSASFGRSLQLDLECPVRHFAYDLVARGIGNGADAERFHAFAWCRGDGRALLLAPPGGLTASRRDSCRAI